MIYHMGEPHPCFVAEEMRQYDLMSVQMLAPRGADVLLIERIRELETENAELRRKNDHLEWSVATLRELADRPTWSE